MTTTTTGAPPVCQSLERLNHIVHNAIPWLVLGLLVVLVLRAVWVLHFKPKRDPDHKRWDWQRDGSVKGPRIAQWRMRRAFAPYAEIIPYQEGDDTDEWVWPEAVPRRLARRLRAARRLWPDLADALDMPSQVDEVLTDADGRCWRFTGKDHQDPKEIARRLYHLRIITRASHVDGPTQVDDAPGLYELLIADVTRTPITERAPVYGWSYEPVYDLGAPEAGAVSWNRVRKVVGEGPLLLVGERVRSLYANAAWELRPCDDEVDDLATADDATITQGASPEPDRAPARGDTGGATRDARQATVRDSADPVVLTPRQYEALRHLTRGSLTVAAVASATGCTWGTADRRLKRLGTLGLATRATSGEWSSTPAGRAMFGDLPTPVPNPTPEAS